MKIVVVILVVLLSGVLRASDVLDLGRLEVEGEVRKPSIDFIRSPLVPLEVLEKASEKTLHEFEQRLLDTSDFKSEEVESDRK